VGRGEGWWVGPRGEKLDGLFFFFSFLFQIHFKPIFQTFLNLIFTQISPTIFKGFSQTLLTTFQTYFKFKPSSFF
jgi:hypothetical protein